MAVAVLVVLSTGPAVAQTGERILRYEVRIAIQGDGALFVRELIQYDFGTERRRGIYLDLRDRFRFDDVHDRIYPIEVLDVRGSPGTPVDRVVEREEGLFRIRIGDPDRTITGAHTYEIEYRLRGALNAFRERDELFWNAIGHEWAVPIDRASVRVSAPEDVIRVACYAGPDGSEDPCRRSEVVDGEAVFAQGDLGPREGVTVVVAVPKGAVAPEPAPILEERWSLVRAFSVTPGTVGAAAALLLLAVGGVARLAWTTGRDRRFVGTVVDVLHGSGEEQVVPLLERQAIVPEFAPPDDIKPGQVGTLLDEVAHPLDVTATIVDLAVRGHLRIEEIEKTWLFGKTDWRLTRLREGPEGLKEYEALLLGALFQSGGTVLLSELKQKFAERLTRVQDSMYEDVVSQGWFLARPDKVRRRWFVLGAAATLAAAGVVVAAARWTHLGLVPIPLVLGGLGLMLASKRMPRRTPKGTALLRRALGFRMVIETAEGDFSRFAERENLFTRYLPYAIVFEATEQWAKRFAGLAAAERVAGDTSWYVSSRPFDARTFSSSMSGFARASAGTIAATASSSGSSGFSGGSSGGGGGGGGGGSW